MTAPRNSSKTARNRWAIFPKVGLREEQNFFNLPRKPHSLLLLNRSKFSIPNSPSPGQLSTVHPRHGEPPPSALRTSVWRPLGIVWSPSLHIVRNHLAGIRSTNLVEFKFQRGVESFCGQPPLDRSPMLFRSAGHSRISIKPSHSPIELCQGELCSRRV